MSVYISLYIYMANLRYLPNKICFSWLVHFTIDSKILKYYIRYVTKVDPVYTITHCLYCMFLLLSFMCHGFPMFSRSHSPLPRPPKASCATTFLSLRIHIPNVGWEPAKSTYFPREQSRTIPWKASDFTVDVWHDVREKMPVVFYATKMQSSRMDSWCKRNMAI